MELSRVILSTLTTSYILCQLTLTSLNEEIYNGCFFGNYIDGYKDGQFAMNPFTAGWETQFLPI